MFFFLSKIFYFLLQPIVWVILLLIIGFLKKRFVTQKKYLIAATAVLYLFSNPFLFNEFARAWEIPPTPLDSIEKNYEVAIVMGGIVHRDQKGEPLNFGRNADRLLQVLPLYFSGKVKKILIAGGSGSLTQKDKEAELLAQYLQKVGLKEKDLLLETESRNTYENARNSAKILKQDGLSESSILLSTSSLHLRRSAACFAKQGIAVDMLSIDPVSQSRKINPSFLFLPDASVLGEWYWLLHEWMGMIIYRLFGYC